MARMKEEYTPNEKYRNMFGVERNGYGCERVDLYLAQLEVAFKKIREDNRNLKRDLSERALVAFAEEPRQAQQGFNIFPQENELAAQLEQQGQYIMQLQAQLAEQQERGHRLAAQLAQATQAAQAAQIAQLQPPGDPQAAEALMAQIAALRGEADALRRQLAQPAAPAYAVSEEEQQGLIGKVLVEARAQAEELVRSARQESDGMLHRARQKVDELRAEQERVHSQLQGISYGLRNILREGAGAEYQQRGEEYAAS
jgi:cell division septum initiation protein DivIVA